MSISRYDKKRVLPYEAAFLYDIVADVEHYPAFVPWCLDVRLVEHRGADLVALVTFGYGSLRFSFHSYNRLCPTARKVEARSDEAPFAHLYSKWLFTPQEGGGAEVAFHLEYELRSRALGFALGRIFDEAAATQIEAFEKRAQYLSQNLSQKS